jgi:hypothetical protein
MDGLERQQFIREQHERVLDEARATLERSAISGRAPMAQI